MRLGWVGGDSLPRPPFPRWLLFGLSSSAKALGHLGSSEHLGSKDSGGSCD